MGLRYCKDCPCLEKKESGGVIISWTNYICKKMKTERKPEQDACNWAKEQDNRGWPRGCE